MKMRGREFASASKPALAFAVCVLGISGAAIGQTVQSAPSPVDQSDIVITARKTEERLSRVPISVAAFSKATMDRIGIRNVEDVALRTPGVKFTPDSFGGGGSNISIRGISSATGAATTGVYIDDVPIQIRAAPQTAFGTSFPQVFDLDRIEILRGPQGTLFGAGAEGGAVRFITPRPSLNQSSVYGRAEVSATAHGDPSYEAGVALGVPLIEDKIGVRISGWHRRDGGYVDRRPFNTGTPSTTIFRDTNSSNTDVLRADALVRLGENVRVRPSIYYQEQDIRDTSTFYGTLSDTDDGQFVNGSTIRQPAQDRFVLPSLIVEADMGKLQLTSVSAYFDRRARTTQDYTPINMAFILGLNPPYAFLPGQEAPGDATARQKNFSQEIRIGSVDPESRLKWTVGGFYSRSKQRESFLIQDNSLEQIFFPATIEDIFGIGLTDGKYLFVAYNETVEKQYAVFAQGDLKLTEQLSATIGLRYGKTKLSFARTEGGPLNYPGFGPDLHSNSGTQSSKPFTPKFGLNFQADENNLFYASAAKGFRVGGVNQPLFRDPTTGESCSAIPEPPTFGPDSVWAYEVGAKNSLFGGMLKTDASVFLIDWKDIQQFVNPGGCAGNGFRDNLGTARSRGFDFAATLRLSPELTLSGTVGYVNAKFRDTITSPIGVTVRKGDSIDVTPWQLSGAIDYRKGLADGSSLYFHVEDFYGSHNNGRNPRADVANVGYDPDLVFDPATNQLNMRVGFQKDGIDASVFVNNLLDAAPKLSAYHDVFGSELFYYRTVRPRTVGLTLVYRN